MANTIVEYFKKNTKLFIFILIFCVLVFIYNRNSQTLNYVLKRGTILEYSIKNDVNQEEIRNKLNELNIKYYYIDSIDYSKDFEAYDSEQNHIDKTLLIGLPILAQKNKEDLFNNISKFVFEKYPTSKLIDLKSLNNNYHEPYSAFLKFLAILFTASILWLILMYLIYDFKTINQAIKTSFMNFIKKQAENLKNLAQKTKEKGIGYLLKKVLLDEKQDEEETSVTREIISTIIFVVVCVIIIRFFIGELRWIPSGSMRPTILEHDRVFVEKLEYPKKEVLRGDILVFYPPSTVLSNSPIAIFKRLSGIFCKDIAYIKRVVGLPNEKFEIKKDENTQEYRVFINDKPLQEPYVSSKTEWTPCLDGMYCGPFIIPEGHYFMMGDNRNNSQDSRFWGFLDGTRIIGRANFMFWPVKRINVLSDKYLDLYKEKTDEGYETKKYLLNRYEFLYKI